jgi:uncharacterized protein YukE
VSSVADDDYVPPGDPSALADAASRLGHTAEGLLGHAIDIRSQASSLFDSWYGDAATQYHSSSNDIASSFHAAAAKLQTTSVVLRKYSAELERLIREGTVATSQVRRCLAEVKAAKAHLEAAQQAVSAAESDAANAHQAVSDLQASGPGTMHAILAASQAVNAAESQLASARADERAAIQALTSAQDELAQWRARGGSIRESAQTTGAQLQATLGAQQLTPPASPHPGVRPSTPAPGRKKRSSRGKLDSWTPAGRFDRLPAGRRKAGRGDRRVSLTGPAKEIRGGVNLGLFGFGVPFMGKVVTGPVRYRPGGDGAPTLTGKPTAQPPSHEADPASPGAKRGGSGGGGDGQGSTTVTINPSAGTIDTVTHMKSGETIKVVTYTKSGDVVETITYPGSGPHAGSGTTIIDPGPGPTQAPTPPGPPAAPKPSGGAGHGGSGQGSGTTVIG